MDRSRADRQHGIQGLRDSEYDEHSRRARAVAEPVFANVRYNKGLDRFTLRGHAKVDGQWKLFCLVQNIEKLAHHGYGARAA